MLFATTRSTRRFLLRQKAQTRRPRTLMIPSSVVSSPLMPYYDDSSPTKSPKLKSTPSFRTTTTATTRSFHSTPKQEILPLIGAATVFLVGRYSWKALRRMDDEWEDYQWHLKEYEKIHGPQNDEEGESPSSATTLSTVGVDVGTVHMIWAYRDNRKLHTTKTTGARQETPTIVPTREGGRYMFSGVVDDDDEVLVGTAALAKFYELQHNKPAKVQWPYRQLRQEDGTDTLSKRIYRALLRDSLKEAMERYNETLVRLVVALPPAISSSQQNVRDLFVDALSTTANEPSSISSSSTGKTTTFVPEPVAAIWGAQQLALLPASLPEPVLVLDVGGHTTSLSVVTKDLVNATLTLDNIGGETFLEQLVQHVLQQHPEYSNDGMAIQRLHVVAEAAMAGFNNHTRAHLHVPYIGMDFQTKQPKHLDLHVSRSVLEQRVQETVLERVQSEVLSRHMPTPTDWTSLWTSTVTQLLEQANLMPPELSYILLIGGGAKHAAVTRSVQESLSLLLGQSEKLVTPEVAVRSELVVIGSASVVPNYRYESERGLVRNQEKE